MIPAGPGAVEPALTRSRGSGAIAVMAGESDLLGFWDWGVERRDLLVNTDEATA